MIRRDFLVTAGMTVVGMAVLGTTVWDEDRQSAVQRGMTARRSAGWMYGTSGGCATAVGTEPALPVWVTA